MGDFAERLKEHREQAGLTQKALADKIGLSVKAVAHWEQGIREPSWANVQALAVALGVDCRAFQEQPKAKGPAKAKAKQKRGAK